MATARPARGARRSLARRRPHGREADDVACKTSSSLEMRSEGPLPEPQSRSYTCAVDFTNNSSTTVSASDTIW